jgi:aryl-alcohol dehydrogenase-like predicted oxidoreductase
MALVEHVRQLAEQKGRTPAQLALAWLLSQPDVVPIPGTSSIARVEENVRAVDMRLTREELDQIDRLLPKDAASGARYPPAMMHLVDG